MRRRTFLAAGGASLACGRAKPRLNVLNWSDYVAPDTVPNFEREFGVEVRYGVFESAEEMLAKVMSGNSGWDVVFPPNNFIGPMRALGLLAQLDHARLPHLAELEPVFQNPPWDPRLSVSVPYMHGVTGIVYQRSLHPAPARWEAFWENRFGGRVTLLDDPVEVIGATLKKIGRSLNSVDAGELEQAKREAIAQKKLLRAFVNAEVRDQLVTGDVLMAQAWAVTAAQAIAAAPDRLAFAFPEEGFALFADNMTILAESARTELAHQFLDYLLRPAVSAAIAVATKTATANAGARRVLPAEVRESPVLYPAAEIRARGEWLEPLPATGQRLRDRIWTEIKSA